VVQRLPLLPLTHAVVQRLPLLPLTQLILPVGLRLPPPLLLPLLPQRWRG